MKYELEFVGVGVPVPEKYHEHNGWMLDLDRSGSIFYCKGDVAIYCTPNWENTPGLDLEIVDYSKEDEAVTHVTVTENLITSADEWFALVKPYLTAKGN